MTTEGGSGQRPVLPGSRTPSSTMVLVPERLLIKVYEVILRFEQAVVEGTPHERMAVDRIELHAVKREFEEIVGKIAPQVIRKTLIPGSEEPTPVAVPHPNDVDKSRKG